jgi:NAD-dependent deacetylase
LSSPAALAELLRESQPCVVLTGAGVSTESGIPDFRSPRRRRLDGGDPGTEVPASPAPEWEGGIWAEFDPLEYASIDAFRRDPVKVWRFYAPRFDMLRDAEPNAAHRAIAELEERGLVQAVITQNIDLLHTRAGSKDVIEVHGSIRTSRCLSCGVRRPLEEVVQLIDEHGAPPCPSCGAILKPDVVFFGELLPEREIDRATELARAARLMLVVGSTLEVWPVAGLPLETTAAGGRLAIVNKGPTALDGEADVRLDGSAGELLTAVVAEL